MNQRTVETLQRLMFQVRPQDYAEELEAVRKEQQVLYRSGGEEMKAEAADLLAENAVDMQSYLADWNLKSQRRHPGTALTDVDLLAEVEKNYAVLEELGESQRVSAAKAKAARLQASNLLKLARGADNGTHNTRWGNDYASGLRHAMQKGAILVTTNPVLIGIAAKENPAYWTPVRDQIRNEHPKATPAEIAALMTIKVVVENARLLRPIWELADRKLGLVSLQLSPKEAFNADVMIEGALKIYEGLCQEIGGTPNTVFKVPGTKAGITVAGELTKRGIGVNITVNYSLPQQIAFAGVIEKNSTAPLSFRTQMDGRLDDPIGEELREAGVADWEEVKTWATTAIRQREYRMLCMKPEDGGLGFTKSFCLGASGRGPWNILRSITDGPVTLFLTVFPNKQEEFDAEPRELNPRALWEPVPRDKLDTLLTKSPLFRQSFEPDGMTTEEFDTYLPVQQTLAQFSKGYNDFVAWCGGNDDALQ
ncbi:MAG: transaldolase family protein [Candidatus Zipacnadales bacterium]